MSQNTVYLVTGANRGKSTYPASPFSHSPPPQQPPSPTLSHPLLLPQNHILTPTPPYCVGIGHALTTHLLLRPHTTVIGTSRAPFPNPHPPSAPTSTFLPLLLDDARPAIASDTLAARLAADHSIARLDVVVANAGASSGFRDVLDLQDVEGELVFDFVANAVGPVKLFKGVWPLLKGEGERKFVLVSSAMGSIGGLGVEMLPGLAWYVQKTPILCLGDMARAPGARAPAGSQGGTKPSFSIRQHSANASSSMYWIS